MIINKGDLLIYNNLLGEEISLTQNPGELLCQEIEAENLRAQTIKVNELDSDKIYVNNIYPLDNDFIEVHFS